jgi:hypothetical protein
MPIMASGSAISGFKEELIKLIVIAAASTHPGLRFAAGEAGIQQVKTGFRVKPGMTILKTVVQLCLVSGQLA